MVLGIGADAPGVDAETQKALASQRAEIARMQPPPPDRGVGDSDEMKRGVDANAEAVRRDLAGSIVYEVDREAMARRDGREHRIALIRCAHCAGVTRVQQAKAPSQDWTPDEKSVLLNVVGWCNLDHGAHWFCGRYCQARYEAARKLSNVTHVVPLHGDTRSYARRAYEDRSAIHVTAPTAADLARDEATTPAMTPQATAQPQNQGQSQGQRPQQHGRRP